MMGFSYAVRKRQKRGEPFTGQWLRAKKFVDAYHKYTLTLQNEDGSFSTNWFRTRGDWGGIERKLETTGHILEWLVYSLPEEDLSDPRVAKAVTCLADLMIRHRDRRWHIGSQGHALHALVLYDQRMFGRKPGEFRARYAQNKPSTESRAGNAAAKPQSEPARTSEATGRGQPR